MARLRNDEQVLQGISVALVFGVAALIHCPLEAQQPLPQGEIGANDEPSSNSTLMDRTDLGNVAQSARMEYSSGMRDLAQAEKLRAKIASIDDPAKREKTVEKLQRTLTRAEESFREALAFDPDLLEAFAGLGKTLRLEDKNTEALQVHAAALRLSPDDMDNFAGWAESLMALDMLGNATSSYTSYQDSNPARAVVLLDAMKQWLAEKKVDPGDINPADVQRLEQWIGEQAVSSSS